MFRQCWEVGDRWQINFLDGERQINHDGNIGGEWILFVGILFVTPDVDVSGFFQFLIVSPGEAVCCQVTLTGNPLRADVVRFEDGSQFVIFGLWNWVEFMIVTAGTIHGHAEKTVLHFVHPARFVPETEQADRLLTIFQESHQHLAVVTDDYAGVSGVVTLEDVLEILTGEIVDETDSVADLQAMTKARRNKFKNE